MVYSLAEIMGMQQPGYWKVLRNEAESSDLPEAVGALISYLNTWRTESLIRNKYELLLDYTKKCKAGKIRTLER
jgi:hypothetical protein